MLTISFQPFPALTSARLLLREVNIHDADSLFYLRSSPVLMRYVHRPLLLSRNEVFPYIQRITDSHHNNEGIIWAICLREKPEQLLGTIGFWRIEKQHHRAEIGYLLSDKHQRQGIMKEALLTILNYGFNTLQLHTAEAQVNPDNENSWQMLEKTGFTREAWFKENFFWMGSFHDTYVYTFPASDFLNGQ